MERKIKVLIDYLYEFHETLTKMEVQRILKHLRECGVKTITCYGKEYRTNKRFY